MPLWGRGPAQTGHSSEKKCWTKRKATRKKSNDYRREPHTHRPETPRAQATGRVAGIQGVESPEPGVWAYPLRKRGLVKANLSGVARSATARNSHRAANDLPSFQDGRIQDRAWAHGEYRYAAIIGTAERCPHHKLDKSSVKKLLGRKGKFTSFSHQQKNREDMLLSSSRLTFKQTTIAEQ